MPRQRQAFGELLPDQSNFQSGGLVVADGCLPTPTGYRPLPSPAAIPNGSLGAAPLGAYAVRANGDVHLIVGTATKLRRYEAGGWTDLATGLAATAGVGWRFDLAGGLVIATNGTDAIKKYTLSSGVVANLGGSPPTARYLAVVRGRVLLGYVDSEERKIGWSAEGLPESWTPAVGGPGRFTFASGGSITGVAGGEFGLVFQESSITRLLPAYDGNTWQYDELSALIGCIAPWSLHRYGRLYRFLSSQGWMQTDGASPPMPIGKEKIDRAFMAQANRTYFAQMSAITDPKTGVMFAAVPNGDVPSKVYCYDDLLQKWTTATFSASRFFAGLSQSVTLEQLDATYPDLDAMTTSLDDRIFQGGYPELMFFDAGHDLCALTGTNLEATFTDCERELIAGYRARGRRLRPIVDASAGVSVTIAGRNRLGDAQVATDYASPRASGEFPIRENWNLIQATVKIAAGTAWTSAQGYDIEYEQGGRA